MNKELVINSTSKGATIALVEEKRLVEIHQEKVDSPFAVGDIYLSRIKKVVPGLNAAFVDTDYGKDAFLHYTDLSPNVRSWLMLTKNAMAGNFDDPYLKNFEFQPEIVKTGKINEVLKTNQPLLVQILKEPISTKGPRLSCEISLPGRFLVLVPFSNTVGISRKLGTAEERKRLKQIVENLRPKNFGVVIRTVAQGQSISMLHDDLMSLLEKWGEMMKGVKGMKPPAKVFSEDNKTTSILRDLLNDSFNKVVTNSKTLSRELESYVKQIAPDRKNIVSYYNGQKPIFDSLGITKQIKSSFGRNVSMKSGAYLVIDHTEALHVVDVNSGPKVSMKGDQQSNALKVNLEAADEIARQLRLRDMGGIIVVDFIDVKSAEGKKEIYARMKDAMKPDRARHSLLPLSKFNLMQITRERVRPAVQIKTKENCPTCQGTGKIEAALLLIDDIQREVKTKAEEGKAVHLIVHPFIQAFLTKGFPSIKLRWMWEYKCWISIASNSNFALTQYKLKRESEKAK